MNALKSPTLGSLFAGIGGFDVGFEQAGFRTVWQVEINDVCRAVLADRFPHAQQFTDVRTCLPELSPVDVIVGGFPCQDLSVAGKRVGLHGTRSGLFFDAMHIVKTLRPRYIVLENVPGLISSNDGTDLQTVIETLSECGYVGFWRVLDSRYFGVAQKRRRVFLVAGLGHYPPLGFMADAGSMERRDGKGAAGTVWADAHVTLLAGLRSSNVDIGLSNVVAVANGRHQMVERERVSCVDGFCKGMDESNAQTTRAAGNAVVPQVARWIAEHLISEFRQ